jgi:L-ribulose-5-phosphate 3-epimerase
MPSTARPSISLAQWSLHRTFFGASFGPGLRSAFQADPDSVLQGERHPLEFPTMARDLFGIDAVEYVNTFFYAHASDASYLGELKTRADDAGVRSLLIMCDALGSTGDADPEARARAVDNHQPWMDAAAYLGCHAIRVNAAGEGAREEVSQRVAESLNRLGDLGAARGLDVLVENHGGLSSDGGWLAATIARTDHPRVGTLPDFGNFRISGTGPDAVIYDRYQGVAELMPFARAVSAKSYDFDADGSETTIDYTRMLRIVLDAGYRGHIGIEYEGRRLPEAEGIRATRDLLERVLAED